MITVPMNDDDDDDEAGYNRLPKLPKIDEVHRRKFMRNLGHVGLEIKK